MVKVRRCGWCGEDALYVAYHDAEWGVPVRDDGELFERLMLEGMQAGLSWYTILVKRAHMRRAFFGFDPEALVSRGPGALASWLADPGLIRHRGKLEALIGNAAVTLALDEPLSHFLWRFVGGQPQQNRWRRSSQVPSATETSTAMSKALKQHGFRFVGPTTCYAFMQSVGMVNDHMLDCHRHAVCADLAAAWRP